MRRETSHPLNTGTLGIELWPDEHKFFQGSLSMSLVSCRKKNDERRTHSTFIHFISPARSSVVVQFEEISILLLRSIEHCPMPHADLQNALLQYCKCILISQKDDLKRVDCSICAWFVEEIRKKEIHTHKYSPFRPTE